MRNKRAASTSDEDNNASTASRPRPPRTGPKTPAGKAASSRNALRHGITVNYRHFQVLPWEDQEHFDELYAGLRQELNPEDLVTEQLTLDIAISQWLLSRVNFEENAALTQLNDLEQQQQRSSRSSRSGRRSNSGPTAYIDIATKFERYRASVHRRLRRDTNLAGQLERQSGPNSRAAKEHEKMLASLPRTQNGDIRSTALAKLRAKNPKFGPDGKPYEIGRIYRVHKFNNCPSPHDYIVNYAIERIVMSDGKDWIARFIPLTEFMGGEFLKPQYGLGEHLKKQLYEYAKTHRLYHPGTPHKMGKWPPPVPPGIPSSEEVMDMEMQVHPRPLELIAQREEEARKKREAEAEAEAEAEKKKREEEEERRRRRDNDEGDGGSERNDEDENPKDDTPDEKKRW